MNEKTAQQIIELLEKQDERILKLEELIKGQQEQLAMLPDYRDSVSAWNKELVELNNILKQIKIPAREISDLKLALSENTSIRKNPPEIEHHHYVPKVAIIAAGLFLLFVLACVGWYQAKKLQKQYYATDIKYRFMDIDGNVALQKYLENVDSLYNSNPNQMEQFVIKKEQDIQEKAELMLQAAQREAEAKNLRKKASGK